MEEQKPEAASEVYERACKIHLPRKPSIHFSWAAFEEKRGLHIKNYLLVHYFLVIFASLKLKILKK